MAINPISYSTNAAIFLAVLLKNVQDTRMPDKLLCFGLDLHPIIFPLNEAIAFNFVQIIFLDLILLY